MFKTALCVRAMWLLLAALLGIGLSACKAESPEEKQARICRETPVPPHLKPTISSDGKMIAVLSYVDNCGKKRLRYKNVDPEGPWQELPIGTGVESIRFGLKGHELMITRNVREGADTWLGNEVNKVDSWSELYKVDLGHPQKPAKTMLEGYGLALPIEITPGEYMVMNCIPNQDKQCHRILGYEWNLIKNGKLVHKWTHGKRFADGPEYRGYLNYGGWPNVVPGQGVYWFKLPGYYKEGEMFPDYWGLAFPGKTAPKFQQSLGVGTMSLVCDYKGDRCLRDHLKDSYATDSKGHPITTQRGQFIYVVGALYRGQSCLTDVTGFIWATSITPDGLSAVVVVEPNETKKIEQRLVVLKFQAGQCEPLNIQHLNFEEK